MDNEKQLTEIKSGIATIQNFFCKHKDSVSQMLTRSIDPQKILSFALNEIRRNPELAKCTPESLFGSLLESTNLNLSIGGILGESYIISYFNRKKGAFEANFQAGYKGLTKLALENEKINHIYAKVVWDKEPFDIRMGSEPSISHAPRPVSERGANRIAVYAVALLQNGANVFELLWAEEVEAIQKKYSKSEAWKDNTDMMWQKTAIIRLNKRLPLSSGFNRAAELDEVSVYGGEQRNYFFGDNDFLLGQENNKPPMSPPQSKSETTSPPSTTSPPKSEKPELTGDITQPQIKAIYAMFEKLMGKMTEEDVKENCGNIIGIEGLTSFKDQKVTKQQGSDIISHLNIALENQKKK